MRRFELNEKLDWTPPLPAEFCDDYRLGAYSEPRIRQIMWKYLVREENCRRAWLRINHHLPETLSTPERFDILELSTAHGAMLEIWRSYGHRVTGTDFAWDTGEKPRQLKGARKPWHTKLLTALQAERHDGSELAEEVPGWPYQPVIEALGLDVRLFDGGELPYPFEDKSFDILCCYQAIDAYAPPARWLDLLAEFCRIARKTIVLGFNPLPLADGKNAAHLADARAAWLEMQSYAQNGFVTSYFEIGQTRRGVHPTVCKLQAV